MRISFEYLHLSVAFIKLACLNETLFFICARITACLL